MAPERILHIVDVFLVGGGRIVVDVDATLTEHGYDAPATTLQGLDFVRRIVNENRHLITVDGWPARATQVSGFIWRGPPRSPMPFPPKS